MAKNKAINITIDPKVRATAKMVDKEWSARIAALISEFPHWVAHAILEDMLSKIPRSAYSKALAVGTIDRNTAAIYLDSRVGGRKVKLIHADSMLLIVKAKKKRARPSQAIKVLEKFNPWTTRTLPFIPEKTEATVISRKVDPRTIKKVERTKKNQKNEYTNALADAGIRPSTKRAMGMKLLKGIQTVPDLAMEGAAMEFGLKKKPLPHWKPSIMDFMHLGIKKMSQKPEIVKLFTDPKFKAWQKWPDKERTVLSLSDTRKFEAFCRTLGIIAR